MYFIFIPISAHLMLHCTNSWNDQGHPGINHIYCHTGEQFRSVLYSIEQMLTYHAIHLQIHFALSSPGPIWPWTQNTFMTLCSLTILKRSKKSTSCFHGGTGKPCPLNAPIQSLNLPAARSSPIRTQNAPPAKILHWQKLRRRELRGGHRGITRSMINHH